MNSDITKHFDREQKGVWRWLYLSDYDEIREGYHNFTPRQVFIAQDLIAHCPAQFPVHYRVIENIYN